MVKKVAHRPSIANRVRMGLTSVTSVMSVMLVTLWVWELADADVESVKIDHPTAHFRSIG